MKYILRIKKKFPKCPKLPIKSQVAPVDDTPIYIVFQIDKNITIWTVLTNSYNDFFIYVRTAVIVYLTPNFCFT